MSNDDRATFCWVVWKLALGFAAVLAAVACLEVIINYDDGAPWGTHAELTEGKEID